MQEQRADVLVTGATGFIGRWLLAALTKRSRSVIAVVRNASQREAELRAFVDRIGGSSKLLAVVEGDVEQPDLGVREPWRGVRDVYHLAARFDFGLGPEEARRANVDGTLHALQWALGRPSLRRFVYLGGYRMTRPPASLQNLSYPLSPAEISRLYRDHGAYEASKHESYAAFRDFVANHELPWTVVHPSGVIGDSRTGETTQIVGLGQTIERLWQGKLPALAGSDRTFVPLVAVDYVADVLATAPENGQTENRELTVLDEQTPALPELIGGIARHLGVEAPKRMLPIGLVKRLPSALTGLDSEALGFLTEDRYDTIATEAHARAAGVDKPALGAALERYCDTLVSTRFGREPAAARGVIRNGVYSVGDPKQAEVVFLHGLPWNGDAWQPVAERLAQPSLRVDLPGLGRSAPSTVDDAWLDRALSDCRRPFLLVGHSLGARLAVGYAHRHPDRVRGVVLVAPAFLQAPAPPWLRMRPAVAHVLRRSTPAALAERLVPELSADAPEQFTVRSAAHDLARRGVASRVAAALSRASGAGVRAAAQRELAQLSCPVRIVCGERDPLRVPHAIEDVHNIAGAGHAPHVSRAAEVAALIRDQLRSLPSPSPEATLRIERAACASS